MAGKRDTVASALVRIRESLNLLNVTHVLAEMLVSLLVAIAGLILFLAVVWSDVLRMRVEMSRVSHQTTKIDRGCGTTHKTHKTRHVQVSASLCRGRGLDTIRAQC